MNDHCDLDKLIETQTIETNEIIAKAYGTKTTLIQLLTLVCCGVFLYISFSMCRNEQHILGLFSCICGILCFGFFIRSEFNIHQGTLLATEKSKYIGSLMALQNKDMSNGTQN